MREKYKLLWSEFLKTNNERFSTRFNLMNAEEQDKILNILAEETEKQNKNKNFYNAFVDTLEKIFESKSK